MGLNSPPNNNETKSMLGSKNIEIVNGMNRPTELGPLGLRGRAIFRQVSMVILANFSVLSAGMALGYPAVTLEQLTNENETVTLNTSQASWFASINAIACPLGGLLSAYLLDRIGRKKTIFLINFTAIISWSLMAAAYQTDPNALFIQIMISRFIIGITTGLASSPVGVYSAEVCHPNLRGRLTLGTSIATACGILIIYTLGYFIRDNWRLISILACCISILSTILTIPIPESPSWLMAKGYTQESRKSLKYFRGLKKTDNYHYDEFETEFRNLEKSSASTTDPNSTNQQKHKNRFIQMLKEPEVYKPLLIMIGFFGFQQFSGIFVVIVYAVQFSIEAGVEIDPLVCAILVGITRIVTTFFVGIILDKWGRRPPAMLSGIGMSISMLILASTTWYPNIKIIPFLPVTCIVLYIFTSTLGLMTLPFSMISEVFPQRIRGPAAGITICFGYLMSFICVKSYPNMVLQFGNENVFAFYGIVSLLAVLYVYYFLPETKGKSLLEIEEYFKYGNTNPNNNNTTIANQTTYKNVNNNPQHHDEKDVEMKEVFVKK